MAAIAYTQSISKFQNIKIFEGTLDLTSVGAAGAALAEQDMTITGIAATDILISFQCTDAAVIGIGNARVKAANTVAILPINTDDAAIDAANTLNYRCIVVTAS